VQDDEPCWVGIAVENRQKVCGVSSPNPDSRLPVQLSSDMAVATQNDTAAQYIADLERQRAEHAVAVAEQNPDTANT
jgi:hypothetical protein